MIVCSVSLNSFVFFNQMSLHQFCLLENWVAVALKLISYFGFLVMQHAVMPIRIA